MKINLPKSMKGKSFVKHMKDDFSYKNRRLQRKLSEDDYQFGSYVESQYNQRNSSLEWYHYIFQKNSIRNHAYIIRYMLSVS